MGRGFFWVAWWLGIGLFSCNPDFMRYVIILLCYTHVETQLDNVVPQEQATESLRQIFLLTKHRSDQ